MGRPFPSRIALTLRRTGSPVPPPLHAILNPAAQGGRSGRLLPRIRSLLDEWAIPFHLETTREPGHAEDLARSAAAQGARTLLVVGGDGTIHEVANGVLGPGVADDPERHRPAPALAVVPVGTGNDFFRMVGAPDTLRDALGVLRRGRRAFFDVGHARWPGGARRFVNLLGFGVDVEVIRQRSRFARLPGLAQYLAALIAAAVRFEPRTLSLRVDGEEVIRGAAHLAAVTVGPSAGGGFLLNPEALPDDGALDLCFVEALGALDLARYIPRVIRGTHGSLPGVRLRRFRSLRVEGAGGRPLEFEMDGDLMPHAPPWIDVEIEPRRLPVLVPQVDP